MILDIFRQFLQLIVLEEREESTTTLHAHNTQARYIQLYYTAHSKHENHTGKDGGLVEGGVGDGRMEGVGSQITINMHTQSYFLLSGNPMCNNTSLKKSLTILTEFQ